MIPAGAREIVLCQSPKKQQQRKSTTTSLITSRLGENTKLKDGCITRLREKEERSCAHLVVAVHSSSGLPAGARRGLSLLRLWCGQAVAQGQGLVTMVAGRVLEGALWVRAEL